MARKNLLKGLMEEAGQVPEEVHRTNAAALPRSKGAIGAVSRSIADLKSRSVVELDPHRITSGGLSDRLEHDETDHARLVESLSTYGQQVPILVRPDPEEDGKYQVVYGRRRVLAMRDLDLPVKAMIRDLDDADLIMAQGQENSARRDLSFIERVNFARQMLEAGYDRKIIGDALTTDKTLISRMLSVSEQVPVDLIELIGAAPGTGRDRWIAFARLWTEQDCDIEDAEGMLAVAENASSSDDRFAALFRWLETRDKPVAKPRTAPRPTPLKSANGNRIGAVHRKTNKIVLELTGAKPDSFGDWLTRNIADIHRTWQKSQDDG